ncbi:MAG TPA: hypothetical protein VJL87_04155 [Bdellovibrionota bacterium]|nr:hypothetical protein [Bdellovibrionota bacterium]
MENSLKTFSLLLILSFWVSGCAVALVGAGAAGVYAISDDTAEAISKKAPQHSYKVALAVAKRRGVVSKTDPQALHVEGEVDSNSLEIWVSYDPKTGKGSQIRVKSRKLAGAFPALKTAESVLNDILRAL